MDRFLVSGVPFLHHHRMRGPVLAVVGGEDHDGVVPEPGIVQRLQHLEDVPVDHRDHVGVILQEADRGTVRVVLNLERDAQLQRRGDCGLQELRRRGGITQNRLSGG